MLKISVLVSGGGTNLQAIIDAIVEERITNAKIVQVISSNSNAYALKRAEQHQIKGIVIDRTSYPNEAERTQVLIQHLKSEKTDLIVLAGYMSVLSAELINAYRGKIINIHPSLIPKFCGKGYYGKKVHQAVLDAKEEVTGATVHYVDEGVDTGPIIMQREVPVLDGDTTDSLAERVLVTEHEILVEAIKTFTIA